MRPIFLIGYMGTGKTTLGRALARRLGLGFIDLDLYIENHCHCSVSDIFARYGQQGFRELESKLLAEVSRFEDVIISCGGGTPCFNDNMDVMNAAGLTVWLRASLSTLTRRLAAGKARRPLIASLPDDQLPAFIEDALAQREPHYSRAAMCFESDLLEDRGQIDATTQRFVQMLNDLDHKS